MFFQAEKKDKKTEANKKKKSKDEGAEDDKADQESLDWWSKYFASVETMIKVCGMQYSGDSLLDVRAECFIGT